MASGTNINTNNRPDVNIPGANSGSVNRPDNTGQIGTTGGATLEGSSNQINSSSNQVDQNVDQIDQSVIDEEKRKANDAKRLKENQKQKQPQVKKEEAKKQSLIQRPNDIVDSSIDEIEALAMNSLNRLQKARAQSGDASVPIRYQTKSLNQLPTDDVIDLAAQNIENMNRQPNDQNKQFQQSQQAESTEEQDNSPLIDIQNQEEQDTQISGSVQVMSDGRIVDTETGEIVSDTLNQPSASNQSSDILTDEEVNEALRDLGSIGYRNIRQEQSNSEQAMQDANDISIEEQEEFNRQTEEEDSSLEVDEEARRKAFFDKGLGEDFDLEEAKLNGKEPLSEFNKRRDRNKKYREATIDLLHNPFISFDSLNEDGTWSDELVMVVSDFSAVYNMREEDMWAIIGGALINGGIGYDLQGRWFKSTNKDLKFSSIEIIFQLRTALANQKQYGFPFLWTEFNRGHEYAGVQRFTIPFMTPQMFQAFSRPGSVLENMTYADAIEIGLKEWNSKIKPAIDLYADEDQRQVIYQMAYAIAETTNGIITPADLGIPHDNCQTMAESIASMKDDAANASPIVQEANKAVQERFQKEFDKHNKEQFKNKGETTNIDGSYTNAKKAMENSVVTLLRAVTNWRRTMSAVDPLLFGSAMLEKISGTIGHNFQAWISFRIGNNLDMAPSKATYEKAYTKEAQEVLELCGKFASTYGIIELEVMVESLKEKGLTKENITNYAYENGLAKTKKHDKNENRSAGEKALDLVATGEQTFSDLTRSIFGADVVWRGSDTKTFLSHYMMIQADNRAKGKPYITQQQLEEGFILNPVDAVAKILGTPDGRAAMLQSRQRTLGGNTLLSEPIMTFFRRHGVAEALVSLVSLFPVYGIRAVEKWIPFLNTIELGAMTLASQNKEGGIESRPYAQLLVSKNFKDALILDVINIGSNLGKVAIMCCLMIKFGFEPPDDENKINMWDEWKIGGVPWRQMWYMDDLMQWSMPFAVALMAGTKGYNPLPIFFDGMGDMLGGLAPGQVTDFILNLDEQWVQNQITVEGGNAVASKPSDTFDMLTTELMVKGVEVAGSLFPPRFIRQMYINGGDADDFDRTSWYKYTDDSQTDVEAVSYREARIRQQTRKNPFLAFGANLFTGNLFSGTGYDHYQQPLATMLDPMQSYTANRFKINIDDPEFRNEDGSVNDEAVQEVVDDMISVLEKYDNPAQIANLGICWYGTSRYYCSMYLEKLKDSVWSQYHERKNTAGEFTNNGKTTEENDIAKSAWYDECKARADYYDKLKSNLWSTMIPSEPTEYVRYKTDWQNVYTDAEGNAASNMDYLISRITGKNDISAELVPYGNYKNMWDLAATHVNETGTYDFQTQLDWWDSDWSNWEAIKEIVGEGVIEYGRFEGEKIVDVISGYGNSDKALLGLRAYVPVKKKNDLSEYKDKAEKGSKKTETTTTNTTNGGWSNGLSSGSSSYNPKIYSNPRSLNVDRAATMGTQRPYSANRDYLNPGFSTKGSREAYKRQDI